MPQEIAIAKFASTSPRQSGGRRGGARADEWIKALDTRRERLGGIKNICTVRFQPITARGHRASFDSHLPGSSVPTNRTRGIHNARDLLGYTQSHQQL